MVAVLVAVLWASAASAFCTVAGNCEPTPVGSLSVIYIGDGDKPAAAKFTVYAAGKPATLRNVVLRAATGKPVEVLTGAYDVKVHGAPPLWARGVVIERNQTAAVQLGGFGKLLVGGNNASGKPVRAGVVVYISGAKREAENIVTIGKTNRPVRVVAGTYDIRAKLRPDVWFDKVTIVRGKTTSISLPQPSSLRVVVADPDGKPLGKYVFIKGVGDKKDIRATRKTNRDISMVPGRYDIRVALAPNVWFRNVEVLPGRAIKLDLPQRGRLLVRMSGTGKGSSKRFWVRTHDKKKDVVIAGRVNKPVAVGPGTYDVSVKIAGKWEVRPIAIKPGKTSTLEFPAK